MKNSKLVLTIKVLLTATIFLFVGSAAALAEYPDRPITMYIGYKAGGGTDTVGRVLAKAGTASQRCQQTRCRWRNINHGCD